MLKIIYKLSQSQIQTESFLMQLTSKFQSSSGEKIHGNCLKNWEITKMMDLFQQIKNIL